MPRRARDRAPRPVNVSENRLPRGIARQDKKPEVCSRCGSPAQSPYICNSCKSVLTVTGRRLKEAKDPKRLKARRAYNADWMRLYRQQLKG